MPATEGPSELWVLFGREVGVVTATTVTYPDSYRKETCYYLYCSQLVLEAEKMEFIYL